MERAYESAVLSSRRYWWPVLIGAGCGAGLLYLTGFFFCGCNRPFLPPSSPAIVIVGAAVGATMGALSELLARSGSSSQSVLQRQVVTFSVPLALAGLAGTMFGGFPWFASVLLGVAGMLAGLGMHVWDAYVEREMERGRFPSPRRTPQGVFMGLTVVLPAALLRWLMN